MLKAIKVSSYPHLKEKSDQQEVHRELHKQAFPNIWQKETGITMDQLAELLHG